MGLKERIQLVLAAGYTKAQLARAAGKTPAAVTFWLDGSSRTIKADSAAGIEALTGFSAVWLATGRGSRKVAAQKEVASGDVGPRSGKSVVPILSEAQALEYPKWVDNFLPAIAGLDLHPTLFPVFRQTFAVRVSEVHLDAALGKDTLLIIEPSLTPVQGDFVLAELKGHGAVYCRVHKEADHWRFVPLRGEAAVLHPADVRVVGVVRAAKKFYR